MPAAMVCAWNSQLCDTVRRDILSQQFDELTGSSGITLKTAVVIYGDNNHWFAARARAFHLRSAGAAYAAQIQGSGLLDPGVSAAGAGGDE